MVTGTDTTGKIGRSWKREKRPGLESQKPIQMNRLKEFGILISGLIATKFVYDFVGGDEIADDLRQKVKQTFEEKNNGRGNIPGV